MTIKAITARPDGPPQRRRHHITLDKAIKTMRETGSDMMDKYKETAAAASSTP